MELLDGHTLEQRLAASGPLPPHAALRICAEVAAALAAAHAQGLVHRDVKPDNVMLTPIGAKVLDFGIAAIAGDPEIDFEGRLMGTPAYLAPERLDAGEVLPACDVYALGVLAHLVLTGRLPWRAEAQTRMLRAHTYVEPAPLPEIAGVPPEIHRLYHWCLARDPADRPPAAEAARILLAAGEPSTVVRPEETRGEPATVVRPAGTVGASASSDGPTSNSPKATMMDSSGVGRRSWRRRRVLLAVGVAVFAVVAMAGSLGDASTHRHESGSARTGTGPDGTTSVGLPLTAEPPGPADTHSTVPLPVNPGPAGPQPDADASVTGAPPAARTGPRPIRAALVPEPVRQHPRTVTTRNRRPRAHTEPAVRSTGRCPRRDGHRPLPRQNGAGGGG
ncbi:hypothetical protein GCM10027614_53940 [Micromonospora vulcania]